MKTDKHIHILGAGSMGLLWAASLASTGKKIFLIPRKPVDTPKQSCITFTHHDQSVSKIPIQLDSTKSTTVIQTLLVCTKSFDALQAITQLKHRFDKNTHIVLLQNGMGFQQDIIHAHHTHKIYAGISTEGALRTAPFHVQHTGLGDTHIGAIHNANTAQLNNLIDSLNCPLHIAPHAEILAMQWQKLAINCAINALTALHDCRNGELAHNAQAQLSINKLTTELHTVAKALNIDHYLINIESAISHVIQKTASNSSSMREDIRQQRRTEIQSINGFVIQQAQTLGIEVHEHQRVYDAIRQLEKVRHAL